MLENPENLERLSLSELVNGAKRELGQAIRTVLDWSVVFFSLGLQKDELAEQTPEELAATITAIQAELEKVVGGLIDVTVAVVDFVDPKNEQALIADLPPADPTIPREQLIEQARTLSIALTQYITSGQMERLEDTRPAIRANSRIAWNLRHAFGSAPDNLSDD